MYVQEVLGLPKIIKNLILTKFLPPDYGESDLTGLYKKISKLHPE